MKKALITGITGQDGSYLAEFLIDKGYVVHGIKRRTSRFITDRIDHLLKNHQEKNKNLILHYGDLTDTSSLIRIINETRPDEIYNLGAMSHVSFETPEYTADVDAMGTLRILEAIRILKLENKVRYYQASTSELYGKVLETPQDESTPFNPRSPYAVAKLYSYYITKNYREAYKFFACNGILFNHESPLRGETFVTRKITIGIAKMYYGEEQNLYLGNLDSLRDWGHAKDYVVGMWKMLQYERPEDFVLATGISHSIRDFLTKALRKVNIRIEFRGEGINEVGVVKENFGDAKVSIGQEIIKIDPRYFRPSEVETLTGDSSKAKKLLNWKPKYTLDQLIDEMIMEDLKKFKP